MREYDGPVTAAQVAKDISMGLYRNALCARVNGEVKDLLTPIGSDSAVEFLDFDSEGGKRALWHTSSHLMAQAVLRLYPETKLAIGPSIDNGFYYDFDCPEVLNAEAIEKNRKRNEENRQGKPSLERFELPRDEALGLMAGNPYKVELIEGLPEGAAISFYRQGEFTDLCAGPHLENVARIKAIKLFPATGAYWRGDEKNKMLAAGVRDYLPQGLRA